MDTTTGRATDLDSARGRVQRQYDAQGRLLTVRTSWGTQHDYTYDPPSGALHKTVLMQGGHTATLAFDQGKPTRIRHFDGSELYLTYYGSGSHRGRLQQVHTPNGLASTYAYDEAHRLTALTYDTGSRLVFTYDSRGRVVGVAQVSSQTTPAR
jgi:YD repeat-containing protein